MNLQKFCLCIIILMFSCCQRNNTKVSSAYSIPIDAEICSITFYELEKLIAVAINNPSINVKIIDIINSAKYHIINAIDNNLRGSELNSLTIVWRNGSTPKVFQICRDDFAVSCCGETFSATQNHETAVKIYELLADQGLVKKTKVFDPFK